MDQLGSDLQLQVLNLVLALRDITKKERKQLLDRVHEDCCRVREDMSQMLSIQHYLVSLLAETDPFLLIWVRTSTLAVTTDSIAAVRYPSELLWQFRSGLQQTNLLGRRWKINRSHQQLITKDRRQC